MTDRLKVVVAPDSFKHSLSAEAVAEHIAAGIYKVFPDAEVTKIPMADGGEGLVKALTQATQGKIYTTTVKDPLLREITSFYGVLGDGQTAVVEMAAASGIELIKAEERNLVHSSTYGTGQLIKKALDHGCRKIIVGLGGSATNDGGAGMAQALGVQLLDKNGQEIGPGGGALGELSRIDMSGLDPRLAQCEIIGACDVSNPLTGKNGASFVYGPQKGGTAEVLQQLDENLAHYAKLIKQDLGLDVLDIPGAGAAGGLGAGLMAFLQARLTSGFEVVQEAVALEAHIAVCDLIVSGEGQIDGQSVFGKTPIGIARLAQKHQKPLILLAGSVGEGAEELYMHGVSAIFSIINRPMSLEEAIKNTGPLLQKCTESVMRIIQRG